MLARLASPATRIVTLTVTEKGYCHNPATGDLDLGHPDIRADLAGQNPPRSTLGWLVRGLGERRAAGAAGLTVLCCDNMASNGRTLRGLVHQFAAGQDPGPAACIEGEVRFPSSMVDRIVPAATPAALDHAAAVLGLRDEAAVSTEGFAQWVIEDDFAAGRPCWEAVGVELVRDVRPYQEVKLRLLNGAHSAIAYLGALLGKPFVADVMADPELARFIERLMREEIAPLTPSPPGFDGDAYVRALLRRFANRSLQHRTLQIAMDGSQKIPVRWLPMLREGRSRVCPADTSSPRSRPGSASSPAATKPGGSCRSTTRWRHVCARSRRPAPRTRRRWSEPRLRSMRCSAATCGKIRPWSTNSRPCSRGSHMPACAPPLLTDRAAREGAGCQTSPAIEWARADAAGRSAARRAATIIVHQWRHR